MTFIFILGTASSMSTTSASTIPSATKHSHFVCTSAGSLDHWAFWKISQSPWTCDYHFLENCVFLFIFTASLSFCCYFAFAFCCWVILGIYHVINLRKCLISFSGADLFVTAKCIKFGLVIFHLVEHNFVLSAHIDRKNTVTRIVHLLCNIDDCQLTS